MRKTSAISFGELRRFLQSLGFAEKRTDAAWVFEHRTEGLLVFRLYADSEPVDERDLRSTRKYLDLRGLLAVQDFDTFVQGASAPA
jgi:hypothetical protein